MPAAVQCLSNLCYCGDSLVGCGRGLCVCAGGIELCVCVCVCVAVSQAVVIQCLQAVIALEGVEETSKTRYAPQIKISYLMVNSIITNALQHVHLYKVYCGCNGCMHVHVTIATVLYSV